MKLSDLRSLEFFCLWPRTLSDWSRREFVSVSGREREREKEREE